MGRNKVTASQADGVNYKRAKTWQIALGMMTGAGQMAFYMLMTSATYIGNANFGILVAVTGVIITASRLFDGVSDPIVAFLIERFNSKYGKIRIFMMIGWALMALATTTMCNIFPNFGFTGVIGIITFSIAYAVYILGYTFVGVSTSIVGNGIEFIKVALDGVKNCIDDGIPVIGYCHWSLMDNFEWQKGYQMTFGLCAVDRTSQTRHPKESLVFLGNYKK